jgi:thiamine phosphate synthase YjbQ (UPF0047 family)
MVPHVRHNLNGSFARLVKDGDLVFVHRRDGPNDMPSRVCAALTATQLAILVTSGELIVGMWQDAYRWEHRTRAQQRKMVEQIIFE